MNEVLLVGRLTKEPDLRMTQSGTDVARITLAINRAFKNQNGDYVADFIDVILWNVTAKTVSEYCKKGDTIGIRARLQNMRYTDKNGNTIYKNEVVGEKVSFIAQHQKKETKEESKVETESVKQESDPFKDFGEQYDIDDSQLPF